MEENVLAREEKFHDEWARSVTPESVQVDAIENACTMPETRYIIRQIGKQNFHGKKILEIGCGLGEASVYFAKLGAIVTATDLSKGMVELAEKVARYHNVHVDGIECSADALPFDDNSFDMVYAANVLHHVDIKKSLDEIKRVLKSDGIFVCWDPIKYNPAINLYRKLASGVRTDDEHPIDRFYLNSIKSRFRNVKNRGFWLLTNLVFVRYYFFEHLDPSKVRYWKRVIDDSERLESFYLPLERCDEFLLKILPPLKWWCWNMVIIADNKEA